MNITSQLSQQAEQLGIALSHYDIEGNLIYAKEESIAYFADLLQPKKVKKSEGYFDDVVVFKANEPIIYALSRLAFRSQVISCRLFDEQGKKHLEKTLNRVDELILPLLDYGYYQLDIQSAETTYRVRLIISPQTVYQPPLFQQHKAWGLNVQLYSLRSERNWGIGDFADLRFLAQSAVKFGADFVGINPLHLLYPAVPEWASPYSSSSRRWLNPLYLAVDLLPEFRLCKSLQTWLNRPEIDQQLTALRHSDVVQYAEVKQFKINALETLFAYTKRSKSAQIISRRKAFLAYLKQQGKPLLYQGLFNVLDEQEHHQFPESEDQIGWLGWRAEWRNLTEKARRDLLKTHQERIEFFAWLQWLVEQQLSELQTFCGEIGLTLGIYGDLAVSSSRGSCDVWSDPELYFTEASVGAPPDPLGPVGQNWNIPPYNPTELKSRGFQPFIDMLRANMQYFGVLRIDHIMGLFRLWLIPPHKTAADGLYVHYPLEALMAVLAIESQRHQCLVVGEDLGTVPDEVRSKLHEFQLFSYFVLYFEQRHRQFPLVADFPQNAFATLGTHDLPSLSSFWHCLDLELFSQLGILQGDFLRQKYDQRVIDKQALLDSLHRDGYLPADYQGDAMTMAMHTHLNWVIHRYLADSRSQLIGIQLENLIEQEISFNLPGTSTEYPNWRKKLTRSIEEIISDQQIINLLSEIHLARRA
ncbi:MAG: 4-alpha-glucanotransferase [Lonepinella koalarum]|nr:4-alpha-glucanotransferase [Lonepinella koalarum]